MVNQVAIIVTIAAIMISVPVTYFPFFQAQGASAKEACIGAPCHHEVPIVNPTGSIMTTGSNMTGAAGNTTGAAHDSSIHTTNPAGLPPGITPPEEQIPIPMCKSICGGHR